MSRISLSEVMNLNGAEIAKNVEIEMNEFEFLGRNHDISKKEPVQLVISNRGERKVTIKAEIKLSLLIPCDRCLESVTVPFGATVDETITFDENGNPTGDGDDFDEVSYINGYDLDVDAMVSEEVVIGFPMKVLCSEDCKGICPNCGTNLNITECGCDRQVLDPRMSVIRDIFRQQGSLSDDENQD